MTEINFIWIFSVFYYLTWDSAALIGNGTLKLTWKQLSALKLLDVQTQEGSRWIALQLNETGSRLCLPCNRWPPFQSKGRELYSIGKTLRPFKSLLNRIRSWIDSTVEFNRLVLQPLAFRLEILIVNCKMLKWSLQIWTNLISLEERVFSLRFCR